MLILPYKKRAIVCRPNRQLEQLVYASEIAKADPATVVVRNIDYAVILCLNSDMPDLSSKPKFVAIDEHVAMSYIGVEADARAIGNYLSTKCFEHKFLYGEIHPIPGLTAKLANKIKGTMNRTHRTPYSVIVLLAGYDDQGAHIFEINPFGVISKYNALSIGLNSHSARTYLKSNLTLKGKYTDYSKEEIIHHGIRSIVETLSEEEEDDGKMWNITIGIVGVDQPLKILNDEESRMYFEQVDMALKLDIEGGGRESTTSDEDGDEANATGFQTVRF